MSINLEEVEYLAKLAKIEFSLEDKEKYAKDLSSILSYVEKLQTVPTSNSIKTNPEKDVDCRLREDKVVGLSSKDQDELLKQAPEKQKRLIKTKAVFG